MSYIQTQNTLRQDYKTVTKTPATRLRTFFCGKTFQGLFLVTLLACSVPLIIYYFIMDRGDFPPDDIHTCSVDEKYRIPCGRITGENATFQYCEEILCCFDKNTGRCFQYLPSKYYFYGNSQPEGEEKVYFSSQGRTTLKTPSSQTVSMVIQELDEFRVKIIFQNPDSESPQQDILLDPDIAKQYFYNTSENPLNVRVFREETGEMLLTTSQGPIIISEDFWEVAFHLGDEFLSGLGQLSISPQYPDLFTRVVYSNPENHTVLPIFMSRHNQSFHGVKVRAGGALEVIVLPSKIVSLRALQTDFLEIEVALGPTIKNVMLQQNPELQNPKTERDLDFVAGIHICREGSDLDLAAIRAEYVDFHNKTELQYETDCVHENLHFALLNSANPGLNQEILQMLQHENIWLSIPPQIPISSDFYKNVTHLGVFLTLPGEPTDYTGTYKNSPSAYPDFQAGNIGNFTSLLLEPYENLSVQYFSLIDNWPRDESIQEPDLDFTPYKSQGIQDALVGSVKWDVLTTHGSTHFATHNTYGSDQVAALRNHDTANITRISTTSHSVDTYADILEIKNVDISWQNFKDTIIAILHNGLFSSHLTFAPICGSTATFDFVRNEQLCKRWYLMGATAPLFRVSSDFPRRDPESLQSKDAKNVAVFSVNLRRSLRFYFGNILRQGEPIMRPIFYDFPEDFRGYDLEEQYMVGGDLMVAHPVVPDASVVKIYLPEPIRIFYGFGNEPMGHLCLDRHLGNDGWVSLNLVESDWLGFIKEGAIIPLLKDSQLELIVALDTDVSGPQATGVFWMSDTEIKMAANADILTLFGVTETCNTGEPMILNVVKVYNIPCSVLRFDNLGKQLCLSSSNETIEIPIGN